MYLYNCIQIVLLCIKVNCTLSQSRIDVCVKGTAATRHISVCGMQACYNKTHTSQHYACFVWFSVKKQWRPHDESLRL